MNQNRIAPGQEWSFDRVLFESESEAGKVTVLRESDDLFRYFTVYRDAPYLIPGTKRTLRIAHYLATGGDPASVPVETSGQIAKLPPAPPHWEKYSRTYLWTSRAEAFDDYVDKQRQLAIVQNVQAASMVIVKDAETIMRTLLNTALGVKTSAVAGFQGDASKMSPREQIVALKIIAELLEGQVKAPARLNTAPYLREGAGGSNAPPDVVTPSDILDALKVLRTASDT
jgi:hypothetical protein